MTSPKYKIGLLAFGGVNAAQNYRIQMHGGECMVWTRQDHPGALKNVRQNNGMFCIYGKHIKGRIQFPVEEAGSLEEIIEFSDLLILAVSDGDPEQEYFEELEKYAEQTKDKALLVVAGTACLLRNLRKLHFKYIMESTNALPACGLDPDGSAVHNKDVKTLLEVCCMRKHDEQGKNKLPYKPLDRLPERLLHILTNCLGAKINEYTPADLTTAWVNLALHGVPTALNLETIADDDQLLAEGGSPPDRGYFYATWVAAVVQHVLDFDEEKLEFVRNAKLKRDLPLTDVLNASYEDWDFENLKELVTSKDICYYIDKLTPHRLGHRFVAEAYIGFTCHSALSKHYGTPSVLAEKYVSIFDELARRRGLKPFNSYGGDLKHYSTEELEEFGFKRPQEEL